MTDKKPIRQEQTNIAVLIDGDNMSADKLGDIISFVSIYGNPIVRRIYADWTKPAMMRWKEEAKVYSFRLVEALSYVGVKNTTDMMLVIDAMDLLHGKTVQGFCIVSSDSDYTLLAQRIREEWLLVLGYGEHKTPVALRNSCHDFRFSDKAEPILPNTNTPKYFIERDCSLFDKAFEVARKGEDTVTLSLIGVERIETIEVSLETMKVVQSRGVCNKNTEYHEQILALMQKNMRMIAQRATA